MSIWPCSLFSKAASSIIATYRTSEKLLAKARGIIAMDIAGAGPMDSEDGQLQSPSIGRASREPSTQTHRRTARSSLILRPGRAVPRASERLNQLAKAETPLWASGCRPGMMISTPWNFWRKPIAMPRCIAGASIPIIADHVPPSHWGSP